MLLIVQIFSSFKNTQGIFLMNLSVRDTTTVTSDFTVMWIILHIGT